LLPVDKPKTPALLPLDAFFLIYKEFTMLQNYRAHVAERAALGIPALP
jgi:hypothetical protein